MFSYRDTPMPNTVWHRGERWLNYLEHVAQVWDMGFKYFAHLTSILYFVSYSAIWAELLGLSLFVGTFFSIIIVGDCFHL